MTSKTRRFARRHRDRIIATIVLVLYALGILALQHYGWIDLTVSRLGPRFKQEQAQ